ncbi:MAG: hypothetical protein WCF33_22960 [Pseudonocardiaceae bacterium]
MSPPPERGDGIPDLRDIDGTPIHFGARVEQIAVDAEHGAQALRLHEQGQVLGRDYELVCLRFDRDEQIAVLRPDLVRVLTTDGG